jgi:DNA-binding beta-propeller fold protein YncE
VRSLSGADAWVSIDRESTSANVFELAEVNVTTDKTVRVISATGDDLSEPGALAVDGSTVWVTNTDDWRVSEFNAHSGALIRVLDAPSDQIGLPCGVAVASGHVWVGNCHTNSITELNARNGSLVRVISATADDIDEPVSIAAVGSHVWVLNAYDNEITELNAVSGALIRVIDANAGVSSGISTDGPAALAVDGSDVWLAENREELRTRGDTAYVAEFSATSGLPVRTIDGAADGILFPEFMAVAGGHVWILGGSLTELSARTGSLVRDVSNGVASHGGPDGLGIGGPNVVVLYLNNEMSPYLSVFNATSGAVSARIG